MTSGNQSSSSKDILDDVLERNRRRGACESDTAPRAGLFQTGIPVPNRLLVEPGFTRRNGHPVALAGFHAVDFHISLPVALGIVVVLDLEAEDIVLVILQQFQTVLEAAGEQKIRNDHNDPLPSVTGHKLARAR